MSRFYAPKENVKSGRIVIGGKEARHILDVMRMKETDKVVVFDGTGTEYTGFIEKADPRTKTLIVKVIRTAKPGPVNSPEITLAQALPKKGRMDNIVEKATELGASRIIPLVSARTIVRPEHATCEKMVDRWKRIATEASKQCGRQSVPEILDISAYTEITSDFDAYDLVLMAHLGGKTTPLKESLAGFSKGKVLLLIGPEGDFTPEEVEIADKDNCRFVSLGKRVLKSDTAGLFMLSALSYEFNS